MLDIAADPKHGYSQQYRWGPDYDCSSMVISAWEQAGVPVKSKGATYTGNMRSVFLACGFKDVTKKITLSSGAGLKKGDVLINEFGKGTTGNGHTAMFAGDGKIVHARGQSFGSSKTGDQGQEIAVTNYYNYPWDVVLRYSDSSSADPAPAPTTQGRVGNCTVTLGQYVQNCVDPEIRTIQILLNSKGYRGKDGRTLDVDGELGENTAYAISAMQKQAGMKNINYGTVSTKTWELLLK